jgi:hypothetical protein
MQVICQAKSLEMSVYSVSFLSRCYQRIFVLADANATWYSQNILSRTADASTLPSVVVGISDNVPVRWNEAAQ